MCEWKSKYAPSYACSEPALPNDPDSYCLLHSRNDNKDLDAFKQKVEERMQASDKVDLDGCYFPKDFPSNYFGGRTFDRPVNFLEATFSQWADFYVASFSQKAVFSGATFSQGASFLGAIFSRAYFYGATFSQGAFFHNAKLKEVNFGGTHFEKGAIFSDAEFQDRVRFLPVEIEIEKEGGKVKELRRVVLGPSKFYRTRFLGEVVFEDVDLSQCSFLHSNIDKVDFRYCKFGEEKGRKNVLKDERDCKAREGYEPVHRLYLELKKNFEEKRDWNTAGDFHYGEMECRRKMKGWLGRNILSLEALYYWASGYGERPKRAGLWMMLLILICALFYMPSMDKVSPSPQVSGRAGQTLVETASQESAGNTMQGHTATPGLPDEGCSGRACSTYFKKYLEGLNTSLRVTARLDTKETGWPRTIQSILGPLFIALFALALRRKVKR